MNPNLPFKPEQAILLIEELAQYISINSDDQNYVRKNVDKIYMIAHVLQNTSCSHPDWIEEINQLILEYKL